MRTTRAVAVAAGFTVTVALVATPAVQAGPLIPGPKATAPCASTLLPDSTPSRSVPSQGVTALAGLGSSLAAAATRNGLTPSDLTEILRTDAAAKLDSCGQLLYVEEPAPSAAAAAALPAAGGLSVAGDAFALSSRPGSHRTLYLNFVGTTLTGTGWNASYGLPAGFALLPYDTDGSPSTFSVAEQDAVRETWLRVAEDYAPFDVNVTTAPPAPGALDRTSVSDIDYGATAAITNDITLMNQCGCGGIAYVNVIGVTGGSHENYQPALVFTQNLGNGTPKYVAEATSHELGHNFGLSHDGTATLGYYQGQGAWAPIMGASYYQPVTQWSKGEYTGANQKQDDIAIIASNAPLVTDDYGDTPVTSAPITSGVTTSGVIGTATDSDWFQFTSPGGTVSLTVTPQAVGGDLDTVLQLVNADGITVLGSDNPLVPVPSVSRFTTTGLNSALSVTVPGGTYYAKVSGTGQGDPLVTGYTSYGSLGRYDLTVTTPAGYAPLAITTASLPSGAITSPYSTTLATSGGSGTATWAVTGGALPAGLSLSTAGVISGTPTATGTSSVTVTATDATAGSSAVATWNLTIGTPMVMSTTTMPEGTVGTAYSTTLTTTGGDATAVTWSLASGTLPAGVTLSSAGVLSGTPTTAAASTFTVRATSAGGLVTTQSLTVTVRAALTITTAALTQGTTGTAYSATLVATGGAGGNVWALAAGALPVGLSLSSAGVLSGTPTTAATSSFTVRVTDSGGRTTTRALSMIVAAPLTISTAAALPGGRRNTAYSVTLVSAGGNGTKTWTRTVGTLPTGITLSTAGVLSGRPTRAGASTFTLQVRDAAGRTATRAFTITVV